MNPIEVVVYDPEENSVGWRLVYTGYNVRLIDTDSLLFVGPIQERGEKAQRLGTGLVEIAQSWKRPDQACLPISESVIYSGDVAIRVFPDNGSARQLHLAGIGKSN